MKDQIRIFNVPIWSRERAESAAPDQPPAELPEVENLPPVSNPPAPQAYADTGYYVNTFTMPFDGEKNLGEIGPIRQYTIDHASLRLRSWQLFLESEICQIVFKRFATWVIGTGLKLQAEPKKGILAGEKIELDTEVFNNIVEERFMVYSESSLPDYSSAVPLYEIAHSVFVNAIVGGDVLVVLRYVDADVKVQIIDGAHVGTPLNFRMDGNDYTTPDGNRVRHGIELDSRNQPVAYHVRKGGTGMEYERIPARGGKSKAMMAFMVYGLKYRLDNMRGIPLISAVMETAKKMERYKEATIGSAEERQKIPFFIEHGVTSTGENPFIGRLVKANGHGDGSDIPQVNGEAFAKTVAASTNKTVINMPNDSRLNAVESKNELHFKDFYTVNIDIVCATVEIPPNVAMSKYDSNFSASRAALKDWEHTLEVVRKRFATQFYQPIYNLWLDTQVLALKVTAPGYLGILSKGNSMALAAYRFARWVGANVPHIDPEKEVRAERLKLGDEGANMPLTTQEAATEALNGGDSRSNTVQFAREQEEANKLGIEKSSKKPLQLDPADKEE